jgi:hypothetical protein
MRRFLPSLCAALLVLCGISGWQWYKAEQRLHRLISEVHRPDGIPFEQLALKATAQSEGVTVEHVESLLFPLTINFPDRRCVELRPKWGVAGGRRVYCFSNDTKRLIAHYQIGE